MIVLEKLRYVRLGTADLAGAADFATRIIGLQAIDGDEDERKFRSDSRDHTLAFYHSDNVEQTLAVEVRDVQVLADATSQLIKAGHKVSQADAATCENRRVHAMAWFQIRQGVRIEIVVRPRHSGWRYHGPRDAGITEFFGVGFASTDVEADTKLWTDIFGGTVSDYVGDAVYIALDEYHHRIAIYPSDNDRILEVQYHLEGLHEVMKNGYFLQSAQVPIVHGPGRRTASGQSFVSFRGPDDMLFAYVAETDKLPEGDRLPRQFPHVPQSFCSWGSRSDLKEFGGEIS